jgi:hypothetical protein
LTSEPRKSAPILSVTGATGAKCFWIDFFFHHHGIHGSFSMSLSEPLISGSATEMFQIQVSLIDFKELKLLL